MTLIWGATIVLLLGMSLSALLHLRWVCRLPALASLAEVSTGEVSCSIVIAARDESDRIETTVRGLLALDDVHVDVIVVDDRSNDATGEIVKRLATEEPRVQLIRVDVLPESLEDALRSMHTQIEKASEAEARAELLSRTPQPGSDHSFRT